MPPNAGIAGGAYDSFGGSSAQGLEQAPALGKTGTPLGDLPASVQIIPKKVLNEQGRDHTAAGGHQCERHQRRGGRIRSDTSITF